MLSTAKAMWRKQQKRTNIITWWNDQSTSSFITESSVSPKKYAHASSRSELVLPLYAVGPISVKLRIISDVSVYVAPAAPAVPAW